ncbi:hypothetical protein DIPPA_19735 [Diplonema papillatum]|nr:hypothetical protein DIPPA_16851 [Diplonema papillatum]KAJ9437683.1 hypothetical protein DIPPA_19735 [Diplonema papillatum]
MKIPAAPLLAGEDLDSYAQMQRYPVGSRVLIGSRSCVLKASLECSDVDLVAHQVGVVKKSYWLTCKRDEVVEAELDEKFYIIPQRYLKLDKEAKKRSFLSEINGDHTAVIAKIDRVAPWYLANKEGKKVTITNQLEAYTGDMLNFEIELPTGIRDWVGVSSILGVLREGEQLRSDWILPQSLPPDPVDLAPSAGFLQVCSLPLFVPFLTQCKPSMIFRGCKNDSWELC